MRRSDANPASDTARAFPPLVRAGAHSLILGSAPGRASLQAQRYYAHPRNAFWPIIRRLLGLPDAADYRSACRALTAAGFALWDVLAHCERRGSLDADIRRDSLQINDFAAFFAQYPSLGRVFFNGGTAYSLFLRHALPQLGPQAARLHLQRLPSTSPTHAGLCFADKQRQWHQALSLADTMKAASALDAASPCPEGVPHEQALFHHPVRPVQGTRQRS